MIKDALTSQAVTMYQLEAKCCYKINSFRFLLRFGEIDSSSLFGWLLDLFDNHDSEAMPVQMFDWINKIQLREVSELASLRIITVFLLHRLDKYN